MQFVIAKAFNKMLHIKRGTLIDVKMGVVGLFREVEYNFVLLF